MDGRNSEGIGMADDESLLTNPPTPDAAVHVHDYLRFTKMLTAGAAFCFVMAIIVLFILAPRH
jgi:hypothetical protein